MFAIVGYETQGHWDLQVPDVEFAYNNSASGDTRLAPNEAQRG